VRNNSTWAPSALSPIHWPKAAWNPWLVLATLIAVVILNIIPAFAYVLIYNVVRDGSQAHAHSVVMPPPFQLLLAQIVTYVPVVAFLALVLPRIAHVSLADLGLRRPTSRDVVVGLLGTVAMWLTVVIASAVATSITHRHDTEQAVEILKGLKTPLSIGTFFLLACVLAPIVEELTFRVFIFGALTRYFPVSVAAAISGLLFGAAHIGGPGQIITVGVPLALGGVVLAYVYATSRCYWSNVITHAAFNTINVVALVFFHAS
jgi:membrane protease YdiL (CAAX protease family)